jgi:sigma-E factor negative regulatory protein RseA
MTEQEKEGVSALLDDEVSGPELERILGGLRRDEELRGALARYRLISASLRGEDRILLPPRFADGVASRLAAEPTILAPPPRPAPRWGRAAAGVAIAASVALVAIGLLPGTQPGVTSTPGVASVAAPPAQEQVATFRVAASERAAVAPASETQVQRRLSRYLAEHNEFASRGGANGFMSYTTFVTYDGR